MAITKDQKKQMLAELIESFKNASSVVFSQYQGSNVKSMRTLRKKLREQGVMYKVARKTLVELAAKEVGFSELPASFLEGAIGIAFGAKDSVAPAKVLYEVGKEVESIKIVGAIFEGKTMSAADAKAIATLPSRDVLLARLVGSMKSPISGFHGVLHGVLRGFVLALSEVQKKRAAAGN
ncbi:50S ribosomal protein L10 [Candidatus Gracilibacteria bacterium]|nr:50S ribosomal protein L10 [Candidatus Gracilibacteria bacterium]